MKFVELHFFQAGLSTSMLTSLCLERSTRSSQALLFLESWHDRSEDFDESL